MKGLGTAAASAAVLLLSGAGGAYAADLPTKAPVYKAPADNTCTSILDFFVSACEVAAYGVRFYGTVDVGASYQTSGLPANKYLGGQFFLGKASNNPLFLAVPNALSASNIGFQIKEPLGAGWSFVGQVEAGFDPISLHLLNGVHSVFDSIGTPLANQTAFGDSNSQGAFYNDLGFTGVSHDTWGTLTFFRQNDLMQDAVLSYDPMGTAAAFSPFGFFGSFAGGGDTQNRRDTTAIKYRVNLANWHFGAYGQVGGYDEGNGARGGVQGDVGADYHVGPGLLSMDGIVGWKKDAVSLGNGLAGQTDPFGNPINTNVGGILFGGTNINTLNSVISNNTSVMALTKYQVEKWKLYAGYERIEFANPSDPQSSLTDIAGDFLCAGPSSTVPCSNGTNINNTFYNVHKIDQIAYVGATYALTSSLDVTAAYYHEWQNDFSGGASGNTVGQVLNSNGTFTAQKAVACSVASTASSKCAGTKDTVSALLDWRFAPKWDTYIGTNYNANTGGDLNGLLQHSEWSTTGGVRFRW
jgi:predicted porin